MTMQNTTTAAWYVSRTLIARKVLYLILFLLALPCFLFAQQSLIPPSEATPPARPPIRLIRYEEDWSSLCNSNARDDFLDPLKCMSLRALGRGSYVSLGGEFRGVYEDVLDDNWSNTPYPTNSFWLERFQLHADVHFNTHVRLFLQLESGQEQGRPGGPRPIDKKNLDFLNAFLELDRGKNSKTSTAFRVGRQELQFGSGRLVAVREGPNVRQGFYAARITQRLNRWTLDAFAARPAKDNPGSSTMFRCRRLASGGSIQNVRLAAIPREWRISTILDLIARARPTTAAQPVNSGKRWAHESLRELRDSMICV